MSEHSFSFKEVLRNNDEYKKLLRALALLEAQKVKAIKDLDKLQQLQVNLQKDPDEVYKALTQDQISGDVISSRQTIASVPEINWSKYHNDSLIAISNYNTRRKRNNMATALVDEGVLLSGRNPGNDKKNKSVSHGQAWTEEEQRRLEELLKIYPSEEVEARRWQKIAKALGNRTTKQVCCRVQKYFIKLAKAGLPVPGRMPNLAVYSKKSKVRRSSTRQPSLFFNSLKPKVYMSNTCQESDDSFISSSGSSSEDEDYKMPKLLKSDPSAKLKHCTSFICSGCHCKLESIYWQCSECGSNTTGISSSTNNASTCTSVTSTGTMCKSSGTSPSITAPMILLCLKCVKSNWSDNSHNTSHEMMECLVSTSTSITSIPNHYLDSDYVAFESSSSLTKYNYLDPNFCPAL